MNPALFDPERGATRLSASTRILYGIGGMVDSLKAVSSGLYLLFFYTTVQGLPGRLVGLAAALCLLWDAFIDPFVGRFSDRTTGRFGRRHGWMFTGSIALAIGFIALFSPPAGSSTGQLFVWLLVMSLVLRTGHSMFTVPHLALGADLAASYDERTGLTGYRAAAVQVGAIVASVLTLAVFFPGASGEASRLSQASYVSMAVTLGSLMAIAALAAALGTWRYRGHRGRAAATASSVRWRVLARNRAFVVLTASAAMFFYATVINATLSVYFMTLYAGIESGRLQAVCQLSLFAGGIAGVGLWTRAARSHEKHHLHAWSAVLTGLMTIAAFFVARTDGGSANWSGGVAVFVAAALAAAGLVGSGFWVLAPSMLADITAEHELRSGRRAEGALFGAFSCVNQVAAGLAAASGGLLIDLFAGVQPGAVSQTALTVTRIGLLACVLPGVLMSAAGVVMVWYPLTRDRANTVQHELQQQHGSGAPAVLSRSA